MTIKKTEFLAWAINTNSKEGHGFLGRFYFGHEIPVHLLGCRFALFEHRKDALEEVKEHKQEVFVGFPKARVSRVRVTIEEIRQD